MRSAIPFAPAFAVLSLFSVVGSSLKLISKDFGREESEPLEYELPFGDVNSIERVLDPFSTLAMVAKGEQTVPVTEARPVVVQVHTERPNSTHSTQEKRPWKEVITVSTHHVTNGSPKLRDERRLPESKLTREDALTIKLLDESVLLVVNGTNEVVAEEDLREFSVLNATGYTMKEVRTTTPTSCASSNFPLFSILVCVFFLSTAIIKREH